MLYGLRHNRKPLQSGQALVEFALTAMLLIFVIFAILDFGRMFFAYASASNAHRNALRNAVILGEYTDSANRPYLNCNALRDQVERVYFADVENIKIKYIKGNQANVVPDYSCGISVDSLPVATDANLANGDLLQIELDVVLTPIFLPVGDLQLDFIGQRTIVKEILPGATTGDDKDYDGLLDQWETDELGNLSYISFDDPDGDGCNNGCEEDAGTDPLDAGDFPSGMIGDPDLDGVENPGDNCPSVANTSQLDSDNDDVGDACEDNDAGGPDGVFDPVDNCPAVANTNQNDLDNDDIGDVCDPDIDGDGVPNGSDGPGGACQTIPGTAAFGGCHDNDGDNISSATDNCPDHANPDQADTDLDGPGDACDAPDDTDEDGFPDVLDNCPIVEGENYSSPFDNYDGCPNSDSDIFPDAVDACDLENGVDFNAPYNNFDGCADNNFDGQPDTADSDGDTIPDSADNCPIANPDQLNNDGDAQGDACDTDDDNDSILDVNDNCDFTSNVTQEDLDGDGQGNACDANDDNDNFPDATDNCDLIVNNSQADNDTDDIGDECDTDDDNDGHIDTVDNCPMVANPDQADTDLDGAGNACDLVTNPTGQIIGYLMKVSNNTCTQKQGGFYGGTVTLNYTHNGSPKSQSYSVNAANGYFAFTGLPLNGTTGITYTLTLPAANTFESKSDNVNGCYMSTSSTSAVTLREGSVTDFQIIVGYR